MLRPSVFLNEQRLQITIQFLYSAFGSFEVSRAIVRHKKSEIRPENGAEGQQDKTKRC